jgi:hypothetical protein
LIAWIARNYETVKDFVISPYEITERETLQWERNVVLNRIKKIEILLSDHHVIGVLDNYLKNTLYHEFAHLEHIRESKEFFVEREKNFERIQKIRQRLEDNMDYIKKNPHDARLIDSYLTLRQFLLIYSYGLIYEGLAMYSTRNTEESEKNWRATYSEALQEYNKLRDVNIKRINEIVQKDSLTNEDKSILRDRLYDMMKAIYQSMYPIGFHIVYTVSFARVNMFKLNRKQFYDSYEKLCREKFNVTPIISYGTNKGAMDIKRIVLDMKKSFNKFKK